MLKAQSVGDTEKYWDAYFDTRANFRSFRMPLMFTQALGRHIWGTATMRMSFWGLEAYCCCVWFAHGDFDPSRVTACTFCTI